MQYEPGAKWSYTQSGINAAARIVEVVSGMTFDVFLQKRVFDPLGMRATTFDFARALAGNHAGTHSPDVDGKPAKALMAVSRTAKS